MATKNHGTVVGVFRDRDEARKATRALKDAVFTESQIGVAGGRYSDEGDEDQEGETYAGEGAATGVATGAGLGALWGLGILAGVLPAIGPAIAGGTLAAILSSAAAGAAAAGLAGALIGMGLSKEEAEYYESELHAGRPIVTVEAGARRDEAVRIMHEYGGYDMSSRTEAGRGMAQGRAGDEAGHTLQAHEEKLRVQKTPVEAGEVTVRKDVHEEHKTIDVPVSRDEVVVERRPASGRKASASDLKEGQEIHIPVREEQVNVEKEAVVAEEVTVGKRKTQDTEHIDETLRKESIDVDAKGDVKVRDNRR
jgi:uncharacterized protein (TIGR02271 family)